MIEVVSWKDLSTLDVFGHTSSVFFFHRCNFSCPWCQNLRVVFPEETIRIGEEELRKILGKVSLLSEYVQASGGEPTLHPREVEELFSIGKGFGMLSSLNTNGYLPEVIERLISKDLIDHVAMDLKAPLRRAGLYLEVIGRDLPNLTERILKSMEICRDSGIFLEVRTTCLGILSEEDLIEIAREASDFADIFILQEYFPPPWAPKAFSSKWSQKEIIRVAERISEELGLRTGYRILGKSSLINKKRRIGDPRPKRSLVHEGLRGIPQGPRCT